MKYKVICGIYAHAVGDLYGQSFWIKTLSLDEYKEKMKRILAYWLLILTALSMFAQVLPEAKAEAETPNSKILSTESITLPTTAERSFLWFKNQMYFGGETDYKIYKYNSTTWGAGSWNEVVDTSASSGSVIMYCDPNENHNIFAYAYLSATHNKWFYSEDGETWSNVTDLSYAGTPCYGVVWYGNGTVLTNLYADPDFMGIRRSDDWGKNWYVWKNLSAMYPYTTQIVSSPYAAWRHQHTIVRKGDFIASAQGDCWRAIVASRDGGSTWTIDRYGAPTGAIALDDRIVFTGDVHEPVFIYYPSTNTYKDVKVMGWNLFYSFNPVHDPDNDVLYFGLTDGVSRNGIVASPDKGETWVTVWEYTGAECYFRPYYHSGYVYFILNGNDTLRRFPALANQAVRAMCNEQITVGLNGNHFYYDLGDASQIADVQVSWTKYHMINLLNNSDCEEGKKSTGNGFPNLYSIGWDSANRTYDVVAGEGLNGSKAIKFEFRDGGQEITARCEWTNLSQRSRVEYNEALIIMAWIKCNRTLDATFLNFAATWVNSTGTTISGGAGVWRQLGTADWNTPNTWRLVMGMVYPPIISPSDHFRPNVKFRLHGRYNQDYTNLPWSALWLDNCSVYAVPKDALWYEPADMQTGRTHYNVFAGLDWMNPLWHWVANGSIMNTEDPIIKINGVQVSNGTTLKKVRSPLKVEIVQGGCLNFTFTKVKSYVTSDAAILSSNIDEVLDRWSFTVYGSSGQTSTTQVYCGDLGRPNEITGATSWTYNSATKIATISIKHSSPQQVQVIWTYSSAIPGDVDGDGDVDYDDFIVLAGACGSSVGQPAYRPEADFDDDGDVDYDDFLILAENYGKTAA